MTTAARIEAIFSLCSRAAGMLSLALVRRMIGREEISRLKIMIDEAYTEIHKMETPDGQTKG